MGVLDTLVLKDNRFGGSDTLKQYRLGRLSVWRRDKKDMSGNKTKVDQGTEIYGR